MLKAELVDRERWMDEERYRRTLAVYQALPGPEAHELCCHLGMLAAGRLGAIAAGLGFMLPGLALTLLAAWLYARFGLRDPWALAAFAAVQAVVIGIILRAAVRLWGSLAGGATLSAIAVMAAIGQFLLVPFWLPLALGAGIAAAARWSTAAGHRGVAAASVAVAIATVTTVGAFHSVPASGLGPPGAVTGPGERPLTALFSTGLAGGLLTFGGAYTAIPVLRSQAVGTAAAPGWMDDAAFLDGVAIAGVLPGPLILFGAFVGFQGGGILGALALTAGIFLPAFAFPVIGFGLFERLLDRPALHAALDGIAAAAAGLIAATAVMLLISMARGAAEAPGGLVAALGLTAAGGLAAWRWRSPWCIPCSVFAAALVGVALRVALT
jgi:chromate transporter